MKTSDFDYELPEELIAQTPAEPRDHSRLLVYDRAADTVRHLHFYDLPDLLRPGDLLVRNNTRVLPARLFCSTEHGGRVEVLLLKRLNYTDWEVLVKPGKKARPGAALTVNEELSLEVKAVAEEGCRVVSFRFSGVFEDILSRAGETPLPPYIKQTTAPAERYQTVYAKIDGSAAAPTAGLHFTPELFEKLEKKGVEVADVLLHVGLGTFRPVKEEEISEHKMHSEYYSISEEAAEKINRAKKEGRRVIAVGTTSVRTLESAADENGFVKAGAGDTDIFIYPGVKIRCVDTLITNFHLPKSTLVMLVSAFCGREKTLSLYKTAVEERYRFFSFGDAMMIV